MCLLSSSALIIVPHGVDRAGFHGCIVDAAEPGLGVVEPEEGRGPADRRLVRAFDLEEGRQAGPGVAAEGVALEDPAGEEVRGKAWTVPRAVSPARRPATSTDR